MESLPVRPTPLPLRLAIPLLLAGVLVLAAPGGQAATGVTCITSTPAPSNSHPGSYVVRDNFETGDFRRWSRVVAEGDAWAGVTSSRRVDGACAGRLIVTDRWDSRGNIRKTLPSGTRDVWLDGWFRVDRQGAWGSNVPIWRLFDGSRRIADVHRQNVAGELWLRTSDGNGGWRYRKLGRQLAMGTWYRIQFHVYANWSGSDIDVWVNGTQLYHNGSHWLPAGALTTAMIGAEHRRQVMDLSFDAAIVKAR